MKIAFVYDIPYPWHRGGIEHILNVESKGLAEGHDVDFFTMKWPGMKREFTYQGVRYHAMGDVTEEKAYRHGRRAIREALMFSLYLTRLFQYDYDVVITNAFPVLHLPIVKFYCWLKGAKLIVKVDEVWNREYWVSYIGEILGNAANLYANTFIKSGNAYYVANSSETARRLSEIGVDRARIRIFAPVLEDRVTNKAKQMSGERFNRIIFSGRLIKEKRIDRWLGVVKKVVEKDRGISALLIGEGTEKKKILAMIKEMGLAKKVRVRPFFKEKIGLYKEIAQSKVLLHMSEREGLGIIALESLELGTPVVIPDYSPIPKEVKEMCVVSGEDKMPRKIIEIIRSKKSYIRNIENLNMFTTSSVLDFYNKLLKL